MLFILPEKIISEQMRNVGIMLGFATVFTKSGEEPKDGSGLVHKVKCNGCTKMYTGETDCKLKDRRSDGEKPKKNRKY